MIANYKVSSKPLESLLLHGVTLNPGDIVCDSSVDALVVEPQKNYNPSNYRLKLLLQIYRESGRGASITPRNNAYKLIRF